MKIGWFWIWMMAAGLVSAEEYRTWRAVGGFKTKAAFVSYDAGLVTLKKEDGSEVSVRLERLISLAESLVGPAARS